MKTQIRHYMLFLAAAFMLASCEKVDLKDGRVLDKGLMNFSIAIPGQSIQYAATVAGPYKDGDTIYVKVPTSEDEPLDVTQLKPQASLENNAHVEPALTGIVDFSQPLAITVTDGEGARKHFYVKVLPALPRTAFKRNWFKLASDLNIRRTNIPGLTVVGDHLLIADFNAGNTAVTDGVKVYNRLTGEFVKDIAPPTTFCMQVIADDGGHFAVNRYNIYSAGFVVYYYEDISSTPRQILNFTAAQGCPVNLGRKMTIKGNLKQGKAYIYATTNGNNDIYYWEFQDGTVVNQAPSIIKYASAPAWTFATVARESLDANSDHYITFCNYVSPDANLSNGSRFSKFNKDMDVAEMAAQNHYYKILDFKIFEIKGTRFMAALTQGYYAWDASHIKVYDISDPGKMKLLPGMEGYTDFMLFQSEAYGGTNYNRWGDIAVSVNGNVIDMYASMATNALTTSGVMSYRMKFNP
ncbi:DUF5018 domain-containing protein [Pararcticibacter amylolyticus]|uniref:DUF5018 domain-containing protein n=1 Tax=Pararcticibacter amylolyticus TaxID=2173175 RepID=A0A2U2PJD1_9SPHI|nr:hypothetical protein [Pararcticibacter amylolyticus]PWG81518.1 hypothetical protein DDR33_06720 [Pararcticibacter amylolyticus]